MRLLFLFLFQTFNANVISGLILFVAGVVGILGANFESKRLLIAFGVLISIQSIFGFVLGIVFAVVSIIMYIIGKFLFWNFFTEFAFIFC